MITKSLHIRRNQIKINNHFKIVCILAFLVNSANPGHSGKRCSEVWPIWPEVQCELTCDLKHGGCDCWDIWSSECEDGFCHAVWDVSCYDGHRFFPESYSYDP